MGHPETKELPSNFEFEHTSASSTERPPLDLHLLAHPRRPGRHLAVSELVKERRRALMEVITGYPLADGARLEYAAHIEKYPYFPTDRLRSELIRLQVERREAPPSEREMQLLHTHGRTWANEIGGPLSPTWDRGFICGGTMSARQFCQSEEILLKYPLLSSLYIPIPGGSETGGCDLRKAISSPAFNSVERLRFWMGSSDTVKVLAEALLPIPRPNLKEIHFEQFVDSRQAIMDTCPGIEQRPATTYHHPDSLWMKSVMVTFRTLEEGCTCYFGANTPRKKLESAT